MASKATPRPYSVSTLTSALKGLIEGSFSKVYVEAEISGWKLYPSGHAYFTLKDEGAQISAVMFASSLQRCKVQASLKDGAKVLIYGNVTVYPPRGNYQLVVLAVKLVGEGDLMQRYLLLKEKLGSEGLFDASRKRALPFMPRRIGIVTSEAGAVIHDMCTVMTRRFPALEIRLFPCLVQGDLAPDTIIAGIEYFQREWIPDLLIVARGGGSFEDLFCFNDERLVRALAASSVPTISAVGHETDYTLCDFAADVRAGTPSIAAEIAVPQLSEIEERLCVHLKRLIHSLERRGEYFAQRIDQLSEILGSTLIHHLSRAENRLDGLKPRIVVALQLGLQRVTARLEKAEAQLTAYSPYGVLSRGYSLTTNEQGAVVTDAAKVSPGEKILTRFACGQITSVVS